MNKIVYLNGEFLPADQARVSIFDRGFLFADSLYEVIPFYNGVGFRLEEHLERLRFGLSEIKIELDLDIAALCAELVQRNGGGNCAVYVQITRGSDERRRQAYDTQLQPTVVLHSNPINVALAGDLTKVEGIGVITTEDQRWQRCDIKCTALLSNIMAFERALDAGAQEALMIRDGYLTEGSSSNLFVIKNGLIQTPQRSTHILGGTTRSLILELAKKKGLPCLETKLAQSSLDEADEIWISSSTRGVLPVTHLNGAPVADGKPGPLWREMAKYYRDFEESIINHGG